eukprot:g5671.t1
MSARLKEEICLYANLEPLMKELVTREEGNWIYFGGTEGHIRIYPSLARHRDLDDGDELLNGCEQFDPRHRPWFIAASTRPKDIVFVIDASASMGSPISGSSGQSRWTLATDALLTMLDTLTSFDYVNVVTFSDLTKRLWTESSLMKATSENLEVLKEEVGAQSPAGGTDFDAAFQEAFEILNNACYEDTVADAASCSECQKIILFLTDGRDTSGFRGRSIRATNLLSNIEEYQEQLELDAGSRALIFTFSMSKDSDDSLPRQIACANHGAWSFIGLDTDILSAMNGYYHFLSNPDSVNTPVWVNPYIDAGGQGNITTVSMAVFSRWTKQLNGIFLGVVGHSVLLSELEEGSDVSYTEVLDYLTERSQRCGSVQQNACQLQVHRNAYNNEAICADTISTDHKGYSIESSDESSSCYRGPEKYYKLFFDKVTWNEALFTCDDDGGQLAVIGSLSELEFVAGMSSPDGSWIGANRSEEDPQYSWIDQNAFRENFINETSYWGIGEPNNNGREKYCVEIDRRGANGNLKNEDCRVGLSFICEYEDSSSCGQTASIPKKGYFSIPPLAICAHEEEALIDSRPLSATEDLGTNDIMCDLGEEKNDFEVICCSDCEDP